VPFHGRDRLAGAGLAGGLRVVRRSLAVTGTIAEPSLVKMAYDTFFGQNPQQQAKNQIGSRRRIRIRRSIRESGCADYSERPDAGIADGVCRDADVIIRWRRDQSKEAANAQKKSSPTTRAATTPTKERRARRRRTGTRESGQQQAGDKSKRREAEDGKQDAQESERE